MSSVASYCELFRHFAWVLFLRNFADAKFCENKTLMKWRNRSVFYYVGKSCSSCEFNLAKMSFNTIRKNKTPHENFCISD